MQSTDNYYGKRAVEGARQLLGVRFRHQGRSEKGVDCIGLILWGWRYAGWKEGDSGLASITGYPRIPTGPELENALLAECDEKGMYPMREGDIVTMKWEGYANDQPCHIAMISKAELGEVFWIIHTHWKTKAVSEHPIDAEWVKRLHKCYRPKGVDSWQQ